MSSHIVKQFNEILGSFLIQVSPLVGTTYNNRFEIIIKLNNKLPMEQFLIYALPLREKILNRDETYFSDENNIMVGNKISILYMKSGTKKTPFDLILIFCLHEKFAQVL
jgi:hypothetical protein